MRLVHIIFNDDGFGQWNDKVILQTLLHNYLPKSGLVLPNLQQRMIYVTPRCTGPGQITHT